MKDKNSSRRHHHSFASRLTWRIMLVLTVVLTLVSAAIIGIIRLTATAQGLIMATKLVEYKAHGVERMLSEVYVAAVNTVPDIENSLQRPDRLKDIMKRIVELNPNVRSCGLSFREGYYPEKGRWFCPYARRTEGDSIVEMMTIGGSDRDYLREEWFRQAMTSEWGFWSKPFTDPDDSTALVAWLMPIRDARDSTVAILGVDLSLDKLARKTLDDDFFAAKGDSQWDPEYDTYSFIIDPDGTYLMHPDGRRILHQNFFDMANATPDTLDNQLGRELLTGDVNIFVGKKHDGFLLDGEKVFVSYRRLEYTPWTMAFVLPTFWLKLAAYALGALMLLFILIGMVVLFFVGRRLIRKTAEPLVLLAQSAEEVAKGHFDTPLPSIKHDDEIRRLRDSFGEMQQSLKLYMDELRQATARQAAIESEMKVAHDIQMSMLPKDFPPYADHPEIDIYGTLTPAKGVGGDLFDFFIHDGKLFFCIGDVSGKGIPAALFMTVTRALFHNMSTHIAQPNEIVKALNHVQTEGNDTMMFVTIFAGVLDLATGRLDYCNAGHNAPLVVGGGGVSELPCESNVVVGLFPDFEFVSQQTVLEPGTTLFLFTDGLNEAENAAQAQFGDDRVQEVARQMLACGQHQPRPLIERMQEAVAQFVGDAEQSDDLTMLAIEVKSEE
jgi:sigma-B regulation protein RsbU (phosphoserine phosphatase)